ncbi:helix-turn-helix domain-containing protein [Streptomyces sp. NPDC048638]|uniref:helix-turn-helix domain-containing protein n=1 Tax=Streptomyces sp. NPDC048638 TaxID=3365580 RepID=UPI00371BA392
MAGGTRRAQSPYAYVVSGEWPEAVMQPHRSALVAQAIARELARAMADQGLSANALAQRSGVNRQVITNVLKGTVWADIMTVVELEGALGVMLWPVHVAWEIPGGEEHPPGQHQ